MVFATADRAYNDEVVWREIVIAPQFAIQNGDVRRFALRLKAS
jgi:hypothetical protein